MDAPSDFTRVHCGKTELQPLSRSLAPGVPAERKYFDAVFGCRSHSRFVVETFAQPSDRLQARFDFGDFQQTR